MVAPLMDHRGNVRYFLGAQIDITRLLEGGKGLQSLKQLFDQEKAVARLSGIGDKSSLRMLRELGGLLSEEEADIVRQPSQRSQRNCPGSASSVDSPMPNSGKRFIGMDDPAEDDIWPARRFGPEGRLPGVYQNVCIHIYLTSSKLTYVVSPRAATPFSPYHLHLARPTHTRPIPVQNHGPHRRPPARPRKSPRSPRPRNQRHSQSILADAKFSAPRKWLILRHRFHGTPKRARKPTTLDTVYPNARIRLQARGLHDRHGRQGGDHRYPERAPVHAAHCRPQPRPHPRSVAVPRHQLALQRSAISQRKAVRGVSAPGRHDQRGKQPEPEDGGRGGGGGQRKHISEASTHSRERTPRTGRASLEDDIRLGRVNPGLAMGDADADEKQRGGGQAVESYEPRC